MLNNSRENFKKYNIEQIDKFSFFIQYLYFVHKGFYLDIDDENDFNDYKKWFHVHNITRNDTKMSFVFDDSLYSTFSIKEKEREIDYGKFFTNFSLNPSIVEQSKKISSCFLVKNQYVNLDEDVDDVLDLSIETEIEKNILNGLFKLIYLNDIGYSLDAVMIPFLTVLIVKLNNPRIDESEIFKAYLNMLTSKRLYDGKVYPMLSADSTSAVCVLPLKEKTNNRIKEIYEMSLKKINNVYGLKWMIEEINYEFL